MQIFIFLLLTTLIYANQNYISQVKVIDRCTYLTEPLQIKELGIKGVLSKNFEAKKAIRACEKSLLKHPNDPHVEFLLARAYTKGSNIPLDSPFRTSKLSLLVPQLYEKQGNFEKGFILAKKSCSAGDLGGCNLLGYYYHKGLYKKKYSSTKTYLLWLFSCTRGNPNACNNLAHIIERKSSFISKDSTKAQDYLMQACVGDLYPPACSVYVDKCYFDKIPYNEDYYLYSNYKACSSADYIPYLNLKKLLTKQNDTKKDEKLTFCLKNSCNSGSAKACAELGSIYANMPKNRVNNILAFSFFQEACKDGDNRFACWYAGGYKIYPSQGIEKDEGLGLKYWDKACYIGMNDFACYDIANFYLQKPREDLQKAIKPLEHACRIGNIDAIHLGCEKGISICCKKRKEL